jgi:hypothetical protein
MRYNRLYGQSTKKLLRNVRPLARSAQNARALSCSFLSGWHKDEERFGRVILFLFSVLRLLRIEALKGYKV